MIGETINNYRILEKIGRGGMGVVYKALDTTLNRALVLKFLSPEQIGAPVSRERFLREAQAAAALNHPNIITIYEIKEFQDRMYIAMEYVEGKTLMDVISPIGETGPRKMDYEVLLDILIQVGEGLKEAHEKEVIHRDIKPQNIMLAPENRVKILDFGTAKLKHIDRLTREYCTLGTLHYMSPEQLACGELDHRIDIWSLGVVAYQCLTGELPFDGEDAKAIFCAIMNREADLISQKTSNVPPELAAIIHRTLKKEPDHRYPHAKALVSDLKKLVKGDSAPLFVTQPIQLETSLTVAVMPFVDMSPNRDQEYFCDGISEELINVLTKVEGLKVTSRTSAFQFKDQNTGAREIGEKLKVSYILEGSVQQSKKRLRISTKLINTADGCHVWSERFDRKMKDIFAIQDEITLAVVDNLKVKLLSPGKSDLTQRKTSDMEAYNLYLKGRFFWNRRYEGGLKKAIAYFKHSIEKDPHYVMPYVGIADALNILGLYGFLPPHQAFLEAKKMALRALELDPNLSEAHTSLGWISNFYDLDWEGAKKEYSLAIELDPQYATSHEWYALSLATRGKMAEAETAARRALENDPLSLIINSVLGVILLFSRRFPEAIDQLNKTLEMDENFLLAHIWMGESYMFNKQYQRAIASLKKACVISPDMTYALCNLGMAYGLSGQTGQAEAVLDSFDEIAKSRHISLVQKAQVCIGLGRLDQALEMLWEAYGEKDPFCLWLKSAPHLDPLRSNPGFMELLQKIGLTE